MSEPNESTTVHACIGRDGVQLTKRLACVHKKMLRDASAHLPGCMMSVEFSSRMCVVVRMCEDVHHRRREHCTDSDSLCVSLENVFSY